MTSTLLETKSREKKAINNLLAGLICLAVTLGILFSIYAVRYHYFLKSIIDYYSWAKAPAVPDSEFPKLTPREMANLGYAHTTMEYPETSYINFPAEKKPGVIRIGTFGDSYTQGIEAAQGHDYPSFLQQQFKKVGFDHVEVINFGVKGYGIYQSALLWEYLGKKYSLDYVIFMLRGRHTHRDLTFIKGREGCAGVHARYVLKGDKLELIPTVGENRKEASLNYFRMFPPLRYIRYDKKAPSFIRAVLPPGGDLKFNPFYYLQARVSEDEEIEKSYTLLFEGMAREVKNVIIYAHDRHMGDLAKKIQSPNVYVLRSRMSSVLNGIFYLAPRSHRSALGNDLQARELFALLTGKERPDTPGIQIRAPSTMSSVAAGPGAKPLNSYKDLSLSLAGHPAGAFTEMINTSVLFKKEIILAETKISGLLFLSPSPMSFLPIDFLVNADEPVFLFFRADDKAVQIRIGKMETVGGVLSRFVLASPQGRKDFVGQANDGYLRVDPEVTEAAITMRGRVTDVKILIGEKEVLSGKKQKRDKTRPKGDEDLFDLKPDEKKLLYLSTSLGQYVPIESVEPRKGKLELVLTQKDGQVERFPTFLEYEVTAPEAQRFIPAYSGFIPKKQGVH